MKAVSLRRVWLFVVAALCCLAGRAPLANQSAGRQAAMSVDDIVIKNLTAKGGLDKLKAVNTMKQTATITFQGMSAETTIWSKRPNYLRQEVIVNGQKIINGFDGKTPWIVNPMAGSSRPIEIQGPQADSIRDQSYFDGPLVDYKSQGTVITLEGSESAPGEGPGQATNARLLIILKLTKGQQVTRLYLDAKTYLEAKLSTVTDRLKLDQEFSDYRDVKGIQMPHLIRAISNGVLQNEMKVKTVEFDVSMDDAMFRVPKGS